jgi:hypothetical protein
MQLAFSLTQAELLQGSLLQTNVLRRFVLKSSILALALFVIQTVSRWRETDAFSGERVATAAGMCLLSGFILTALIFLNFRYFTLPRRCRRIYRDNPAFFANLILSVNDDGLEVANARQVIRSAWSDVLDMKENAQVIIIRISRTLAHVIPKRVLTAEIEKELRRILDDKISIGT